MERPDTVRSRAWTAGRSSRYLCLSFLPPWFHPFQINRVALIHCVSCRLPWRLFDPVFQSLHLGQTCFSSVCCTPALEAAASLRHPSHTHTLLLSVLLSPSFVLKHFLVWVGLSCRFYSPVKDAAASLLHPLFCLDHLDLQEVPLLRCPTAVFTHHTYAKLLC